MLGQKETGNERYWKNLSSSLSKLNKNNFINYNSNFNNGLYRIFLGFNKIIKSLKPDIIHVQNFAPSIKTVPIVNTVHDLCFRYYSDLFGLKTRLAFKHFFKRSLDLSDAIICVSEFTKSSLLKFYDVDPRKIFVVYEAADKCFKYIENRPKLKKFDLNDRYFLVVGNIENRKLPYTIINAFNIIFNKYPDVQIVFAGPNKLKIKSTKNIRILGYVSDEELNYLYNGSVSLIYLSLCEGFGLPIIEAMATKTPVICSNIPVFREIADNKAVFVSNAKELSIAINNFLENKDLRKKFSLLGHKRSKFFSWNKTAIQTLKIYEWVLESKKSPITK